MKKVVFFMLLMMVTSAYAVTDDLTDPDIKMGPSDTRVVQYKIEGFTPPDYLLDIIVGPLCLDMNGESGCQTEDIYDPPGFSVTPSVDKLALIDGKGTVDLIIQTTDANGRYYYTVNGDVEGAVTSDTGSVEVIPEFGVLASVMLIGLIGLFVWKRR